jgi:hypothetical protein
LKEASAIEIVDQIISKIANQRMVFTIALQ